METNYLNLVKRVLLEGEERSDRTGVGTLGLFGNHTLEFDLSDGTVPLLTTKRVAYQKALREILWIIRGETNLAGLGPAANIWSPWADSDGDLGPVYGAQLRGTDFELGGEHWNGTGIDQLRDVHRLLIEQPDTRRALVSMWNVDDLGKMALPPCPFAFQFHRRGADFETLDLQVFQRSCDAFLGVPFDLFEYSVLLRLMARELDIAPGRLFWNGSDVHIYLNALKQAREQVSRIPRDFPHLAINPDAPSLFSDELHPDHFFIVGYDPDLPLKASVAV